MTACVHHFILPSHGLNVVGVCKFCGHEKAHSNEVVTPAEAVRKYRGKAPHIPAKRSHDWVAPK